jgi:hypothetical protein
LTGASATTGLAWPARSAFAKRRGHASSHFKPDRRSFEDEKGNHLRRRLRFTIPKFLVLVYSVVRVRLAQ